MNFSISSVTFGLFCWFFLNILGSIRAGPIDSDSIPNLSALKPQNNIDLQKKSLHYDHYVPALNPPNLDPSSSSSKSSLLNSNLKSLTKSTFNFGSDNSSSSSSSWHDSWTYRFVQNFIGYCCIIAPIAIVVFAVKFTKVLPDKFCQNPFIRLLVFGVNSESVRNYHYKYDLVPSGDIHPNGNNKKSKLQLPSVQSDLKQMTDPTLGPSSKTNSIYFGKLLYCFFGLQFSYLIWGLLQEKIMTQEYEISSSFFDHHYHHSSMGQNSHQNLIQINRDSASHLNQSSSLDPSSLVYRIRFQNSQFLVFINRISAFIFACVILLFQNRGHISRYLFSTVQPPLYLYLYCSLSNILSSWCQYEALKFVSFPAQVLSKACKMIPVMIMSQAVSGKKYRKAEWMFAVAISFGMTLFLLNERDDQKHRLATITDLNHHLPNQPSDLHQPQPAESQIASTMLSGILILSLYLTFDSFTSNWQSVLFDQYQLSTIHMMAAVNFYSVLLTSVSLIEQSDFIPAFRLILANPSLLRDSILLSLCSASGQLFIFYTIATFGPIVFTLIMTLRQAFAILLSCFAFSHSISGFGFVGILVVFLALFSNIYLKSQTKKHRT